MANPVQDFSSVIRVQPQGEAVQVGVFPAPPRSHDLPPSYSDSVAPLEPVLQQPSPLKQNDPFVVAGPAQPAYPQGQGGHQGAAYNHQSTTVVVTTQPQPSIYREDPVEITCPRCNREITTRLYYTTGTCTYVACIGLCVIGCDFGCCILPFFIDRFKDIIHSCPKCRVRLGIYQRIG